MLIAGVAPARPMHMVHTTIRDYEYEYDNSNQNAIAAMVPGTPLSSRIPDYGVLTLKIPFKLTLH